MLAKPSRIFDRDFEWKQLTTFAQRRVDRPRLGVVSGRRRQGKTFLMDALAMETGGFYFGATQASATESLRLFAEALARYTNALVPPRLSSWDEAITYLFSIDRPKSAPIVIDEFPYLTAVVPALPSILQREIDQGVSREKRLCLLLCGSAMSVMGKLLAGSAPLRGRASLELVLRPFDYRLARQFWHVTDPKLSVLLHAVVGGTPAYRGFLDGEEPQGLEGFDDWLLRTVLNPATPLFRESRYLLEEEADVRDTALYHSVLAAVADGNRSRGAIASYIGRKAADIGHHLAVLEDCGLLRKTPDVLRASRPMFEVAEPLVTFHQVVMRPQWGFLESGHAASVWENARPRFLSKVVGPHFEHICREFAMTTPHAFGELPGDVGAGVVTDPARRSQIEVDVIVFAPSLSGERRRILSIGEAKWGEVMGKRHVHRLLRARDLLGARGYDVSGAVLACYSGAGFDEDLMNWSGPEQVRTIGLHELYGPVEL